MRERHPLFLGLTRPPAIAGLPFGYALLLLVGVEFAFLLSGSLWFLLAFVPGYFVLRLAASQEPRLIDIALVVLQRTPPQPSSAVPGARTYRA